MEQILIHEPEKNEITSPTERNNDIKDAIKRNQTTKEEKDCTDQLLECTTECDPNDKECEEECVEEYKECEVDADPDQHIIDPNQPWDKVVVYPVKEDDLVAEIEHIASLLKGTTTRQTTWILWVECQSKSLLSMQLPIRMSPIFEEFIQENIISCTCICI